MSLPAHVIEAVRQRAQIVDLFDPSDLQRAGREFLARCPWHDDRRPSLTVSPQRNRVHCFVCNRGADPIAWWMDRQSIDFPQAVQELAHRYGVALPAPDPKQAAKDAAERQEIQRLLAWRAGQQQQFHQALLADLAASGPASAYLQARGISAETATAWGLGLNAQRLTLPLNDSQGRCCGFSGRALGDQEPKYRNSPGDALFQKSRLLYGLDRAQATLRRSAEVVLVEGPLDVIQLHQAGITNAVAALGTALSVEQLQLLRRLGTKRLLLALDGDTPGIKATSALINQLRPQAIAGELELAVVELPAGSDPDALIRSEGVEAFGQRLLAAKHWLSWELQQLLAPLEACPEDLAALERCSRAAALLLGQLPPGPLRQRAELVLRQGLGALPSRVIRSEKSAGLHLDPGGIGTAEQTQIAPGQQAMPSPQPDARQRAERRALRLFLCSPISRATLGRLQMQSPLHRRALACLLQLDQRLHQGTEFPVGASYENDGLVAALVALCPQLEPDLAALLLPLCHCGWEVRRILARDPGMELAAVLDVLEPVG